MHFPLENERKIIVAVDTVFWGSSEIPNFYSCTTLCVDSSPTNPFIVLIYGSIPLSFLVMGIILVQKYQLDQVGQDNYF